MLLGWENVRLPVADMDVDVVVELDVDVEIVDEDDVGEGSGDSLESLPGPFPFMDCTPARQSINKRAVYAI